MGVNEKWQRGETPEWFIEGQRFGVDMVQSGVAVNSPAPVRQGWTVLGWGFSKQSKDGGFEGTGDPFHSVSLFVEGAARALLLLKESGDAGQWRAVQKHVPALHAAALWLVRPDVAARGSKTIPPTRTAATSWRPARASARWPTTRPWRRRPGLRPRGPGPAAARRRQSREERLRRELSDGGCADDRPLLAVCGNAAVRGNSCAWWGGPRNTK